MHIPRLRPASAALGAASLLLLCFRIHEVMADPAPGHDASAAMSQLAAAFTTSPMTVADSPDSAPPRLSHDVAPTSESVDLVLDPRQQGYRGRVAIALRVQEPTRELRFHARDMTVDSVSIRGGSGGIPVAAVERLGKDQLRVRLGSPLAAGAYTLAVQFHNEYDTHAISLYKVVTGGESYLFTQFEDTDARGAFPCWDEPAFKIPWNMTLTVPARDLAVSNTPVASESRAGAMKRVVFARSRPLPSYLIAIAVGPLETVPIRGMSMPGRVVCVKGASAMAAEAVKVTPPLIRSLERYFGRPYPYEKLDLIAAPEFLFGGMENAGAIVFADRRLLIDPRAMSPDQRRSMITVIAHELSHMWFGDLVTMKWWDDIWLNESFASWMGSKAVDDVFPEYHDGTTSLFAVERALTIDARPSTRAMRQKVLGSTSLGQTANELTYNKGQAVLDMFEGWLGREKFRGGVLEYLKAHQWGNAEGRDLWLALGHVSGENIDQAMASFLDQAGVPLVTVQPLGHGRVRLTQQRFSSSGEAPGDAPPWRVPVILRYPAPGGLRTQRVWLTGAEAVVDLGVARMPAWIEPNAGASGYYRWKLPEAMLDSLAAARSRLEPRERIDLVATLTALLRAGEMQGDHYLALLTQLADDRSPEVTRAAAEALNETHVPLSTSRSEAIYPAYVRATLAPAMARFGMRPRRGEPVSVSLTRPMLLRLLADGGQDSRVLAFAESLSRAYRRNPATVPASLAETGIIVGAMRGDRAEFDDYRHRFETTQVPNERALYLSGLGTFRDPALRKAALEYALEGPLRPQEVLVVPGAMALSTLTGDSRAYQMYPDEITQWMFDHFDQLRAKLPPNFSTRIMALAGGCSEDRLRAVRSYFNDPSHKILGGDATLDRLGTAIEECSSLHERESARAERWLFLKSGQP